MTTTDSLYEVAKEQFEAIGVDTESAIRRLQAIPISFHCWQGDDGGGCLLVKAVDRSIMP